MAKSEHPWCSNTARDEAIRAAEDAAAAERTPLLDHRDLPSAVHDLRRRVEGLEAVADHWRRQCEADADAENREAAVVSREGVTAAPVSRPAETEPTQPAPPSPADGLRTERVTLEVTIRDGRQFGPQLDGVCGVVADYIGISRQRGESVRVVEEATIGSGDVFADVDCGSTGDEIVRLTAERDAAIRERDEAKEESERLREQVVIRRTTAANLHGVIRERDQKIVTLEARVRELESAAAAPAANASGVSNPEPISGAGKSNHPGKLDSSQEPVAWKMVNELGKRIAVLDEPPSHGWSGCTVVPLFSAPQPPRGWLTEEEREALESARLHLSNSDYLDEATERECKWASDVVRRLLTRSTPPLVRRPKVFQTHEFSAALLGVMELRDRGWIAAIREAGGEVE